MTSDHTFTFKAQSFYVACAPEAGVWSYGGCLEEAINSLADKLRSGQNEPRTGTGNGGNSHAVN